MTLVWAWLPKETRGQDDAKKVFWCCASCVKIEGRMKSNACSTIVHLVLNDPVSYIVIVRLDRLPYLKRFY